MDEIVRRITIVGSGSGSPNSEAEVLFEREEEEPKTSRMLRPVEKMQRRMIEAHKAFADEALAQHDKAASKRKDGWLRDGPVIVFKAGRKAFNTLTEL